MNPREAIEEAHGLWELRAMAVIALLRGSLTSHEGETNYISRSNLLSALDQELKAFKHWQSVSDLATLPCLHIQDGV